MKKLTKKLMLSILTVALTFIALGTSTFAWFSMNSTVTATGMKVRTQVSDNLLIADDTLTSAAIKADNLFGNSLVQNVDGLLQPVSTVNGVNFFYTDNSNVLANGAAQELDYNAYDPSSLTAFRANSVADAVGYVDYVFQLKAINGNAASQIRLTQLKLTYGGSTDNGKAYRVAMFVENLTVIDNTTGNAVTTATPSGAVGTLKTIFTPSGAANQTTGKAVDSVSSKDTVTYCAANNTAVIDVAANKTAYFKLVFRLWLEGEDTTCKNDTYMSLTDDWILDLKLQLLPADTAANAVVNIEKAATASKLELTIGTDTASTSNTEVINGTTYYPVGTKQVQSKQLYTLASGDLTTSSKFFIIDEGRPIEVTNEVKVNPAP